MYQSKFIMLDQHGLDYRIPSLCNLYTPSSHLKTLTIASKYVIYNCIVLKKYVFMYDK